MQIERSNKLIATWIFVGVAMLIVQVLIGERREQGVRSGTRCFWDASTDSQATENFVNVSFGFF